MNYREFQDAHGKRSACVLLAEPLPPDLTSMRGAWCAQCSAIITAFDIEGELRRSLDQRDGRCVDAGGIASVRDARATGKVWSTLGEPARLTCHLWRQHACPKLSVDGIAEINRRLGGRGATMSKPDTPFSEWLADDQNIY